MLEINCQNLLDLVYHLQDAAKDDVLQKIQVKFNLSKEQAMEKIALYWKCGV